MSNLPNVIVLASTKMKNLATFDEQDLQVYRLENMVILADYIGLTSHDAFDETMYNDLQKLLLSRMIVCDALQQKILSNSAGNSSGDSNTNSIGKRIKKAKADVVDAEFVYEDSNTILKAGASDLYMECRKHACRIAYQLGYKNFPLCKGLDEFQNKTTPKPQFRRFQGKC